MTRTATGEIFHLSEKAKASGDPFLALREIPRLYSDMANRQIRMADGERPLILVNGNRYHQDIAAIDPREIESVEVIDVVKARYLKEGYQKIVNIKLKKKANPFIYWEVATRHNVPWRKGLGVAYFEVGNTRYALYGRAVYNYLHDEHAELGQTQANVGYLKRQSGTTRQDGHDYLGELQFRWMATDKDYIVAHVYGTKAITEDQGRGEGLLAAPDERPFTYSTTGNDDSYVLTASLFHKHTFSESSVLETTLAYNKNGNETDGGRLESYADDLFEDYYLYKNHRHSGRLDIDYSLDLANGANLAVGSQTRFTNDRIHQVSDQLPLFKHRRWDEYLYADYTHSLDRLSYMLSAGAEGIWLRAGDADNRYFRPRVSLSGTYNFSENLSARLGYQLGNTSPDISQLNPYNLSTDSLTRTAGNPYLMPSRDHEWSFSSTYNLKGFYLSPSARYRLSADGVEAYGYNDADGVYVSTYRNSRRLSNLRLGGQPLLSLGRLGLRGRLRLPPGRLFRRPIAQESFPMRAERQRDDQEMVFRGGCRLHELRVHGALAEELPGALVLDVASLVLFHERFLHLGGDREHAGLPPLRHRLPERPLFVADRPQASQRFLQPVDPDPLHVPQEPGQADARAAESGRAGGGDPVVGPESLASDFAREMGCLRLWC